LTQSLKQSTQKEAATWSLRLDVRLPARKQAAEVVCVPRFLDEMVDLACYAQLHSVLKTREFLSEAQKNALSHFVHRLRALFYKPFHQSVNTVLYDSLTANIPLMLRHLFISFPPSGKSDKSQGS